MSKRGRRLVLIVLAVLAVVFLGIASVWPRSGAWVSATDLVGTWTHPEAFAGNPSGGIAVLDFQRNGTGEGHHQVAGPAIGFGVPFGFTYQVAAGRVRIKYKDGASATLQVASYSLLQLNATALDPTGSIPSGSWTRGL